MSNWLLRFAHKIHRQSTYYCCYILFPHIRPSEMGKKLLLMDVDCGVDDAQAIMMALAAPNVQLLGITCCHGNTPIDNVCKNVLRVLKVCHRMEIPVFRGACLPLLEDEMSGAVYHGTDGLGDAPDPSAPGLEQVQTEHAVNAMIRIIAEHPGQVRRTQCREDNYNRQHSVGTSQF
uniref:Inosine/uridine-preferring nucleoside hydrolase domain-containing protein n=2 Tax=Callorhinchus milii TaxID=7868 RepID=A0A4W3JKQ5_CALMI